MRTLAAALLVVSSATTNAASIEWNWPSRTPFEIDGTDVVWKETQRLEFRVEGDVISVTHTGDEVFETGHYPLLILNDAEQLGWLGGPARGLETTLVAGVDHDRPLFARTELGRGLVGMGLSSMIWSPGDIWHVQLPESSGWGPGLMFLTEFVRRRRRP